MKAPTLVAVLFGAVLASLAMTVSGARFWLASPHYIRDDEGRLLGMLDAVVVADLDGDGLDDIAGLTEASYFIRQQVVLVFQQPDGTLSVPTMIEAPNPIATDLHAVDLDRDGASELVLGHVRGLVVYDWTSSGTTIMHRQLDSGCQTIASGDIDRDGWRDVLCVGTHGAASRLDGRSDGSIARGYAMELPGFGGSGSQALLEDVTGDGWPDVLLADRFSNSLFVLPGDRRGGFEPGIAYPMAGDEVVGSHTVAVADIDADGVEEVVIARSRNRPVARLLVMQRNASGYLEYEDEFQSLDLPTGIIARDMDQDGRIELIVSHSGWFSVSRYLGREDGPDRVPLFSDVDTSHNARRLAVGDLDSDGQMDVVVANRLGVSLLYGGREQPADLDADLASEVVWRHPSGRHVAWSAANAQAPLSIPETAPTSTPQVIANLDGNEGSELVWRDLASGENAYWWSGSIGVQPLGHMPAGWRVVAAGDFDGDGASDLFWRNGESGSNALWLAGQSARQQAVPRVADTAWSVVGAGDFDADGRSDLLWRHSASGRNVVWPGASKTAQRALPGATLDWALNGVGDFDRNGADDVVWRNGRSGRNIIWLAADATTPMPVKSVRDASWTIAAVGDYDGDGYSDLLWRHQESGANAIWLRADSRLPYPVRNVRDTRWQVVH